MLPISIFKNMFVMACYTSLFLSLSNLVAYSIQVPAEMILRADREPRLADLHGAPQPLLFGQLLREIRDPCKICWVACFLEATLCGLVKRENTSLA